MPVPRVIAAILLALSVSSCGFAIDNQLDIDEAPKQEAREDALAKQVARYNRERDRQAAIERRTAEQDMDAESQAEAPDTSVIQPPTVQQELQAEIWCPSLRDFLNNGEKAMFADTIEEMRQWTPGLYANLERVSNQAPEAVRVPAGEILPGLSEILGTATATSDVRTVQRSVQAYLVQRGSLVAAMIQAAAPLCASVEELPVFDPALAFTNGID